MANPLTVITARSILAKLGVPPIAASSPLSSAGQL